MIPQVSDYLPDYQAHFNWSSIPPMHSIFWPMTIVPIYLVVIYSIQWWVKNKRNNEPFPVNALFGYHNLLMSLFSLVMFLGCLVEVVRRTQREGWQWLICEPVGSQSSGSLYFWSYIYYLSKYYELLDTVFLALKGRLKGWGGLQVYHHSVVVFMAWWWLEYTMSLQFYGLLFNTSVHVIMYYYFYLAAFGVKPWWRSYITMYQILQFVSSCSLLLPCWYLHLTGSPCSGQYALLANLVFNVTLLSEFSNILFASFADKKGKQKST